MQQSSLEAFIYQHRRYRGHWTPENLAFNANLQEFAERVSYITSLETNGKLSPQEAYASMRQLWQQLGSSHQQLGIGRSPESPQN